MSIRLRKWKDEGGVTQAAWSIDVKMTLPSRGLVRARKASPINTKRGAQRYEHAVRQSMLDGSYFNKQEVRPVTPTLTEFAPRFLAVSEANNKPSAVEAKRVALDCHLLPALGHKCLDTIGNEDIELLKALLVKAELAKKTINNIVGVLRRLLNLAVEWGVIPHAPRIRALKVARSSPTFLDFEEADKVIAGAADSWKTMVRTALRTGLRIGELLALRWEDVDLKAGRLVVKRTLWRMTEGPPKGNRERFVPLSPSTVTMLAAHRHLRGPYVFCHDDGRRFSHSEVKKVVPAACTAAGLSKRVTWHGLRHTFASHLVMRRQPLRAVQELLGHATIDMTMRYAHLSPNVTRDAVMVLEAPAAVQNWA